MTKVVIDFEGVNAPNALASIQETVVAWEKPAYYGLVWDGVGTVDGVRRPGSGYQNCVTSGDSVAYNELEDPGSFWSTTGDFTLDGGWFAAAWNNGLTMTVVGYDDGREVARQLVTLNVVKQWIVFDAAFSSIDKVVFWGEGGVDNTKADKGDGTHVVMDNLTLSGESMLARFEQIANQNRTAEVQDGYSGVNWTNVFAVDDGFTGIAGVTNGIKSKEAGAYTVAGTVGSLSSAGRDFDLTSGFFASTGPASQQVVVQGYDNGVLIAEQTLSLSTRARKFILEGFESVDEVRFQSGGVAIAMDDLQIVLDPPGVGYMETFPL